MIEGKKKLCVIIPAFDEQETIAGIVSEIAVQSQTWAGKLETTILVIDDGSTDATLERALAAGASRVVKHRTNMGLGAAARTGLRTARDLGADFAVKIDADGQHDPADIWAILEPLRSDEADIVYGNRFTLIEYRMPLVRRIGNIAFTSLMRWLTRWPLRDSQPGIFGVNAEYLSRFFLPGDYNYTQQILLDAYNRGLRFAHADVRFLRRESGKSFVSLSYPVKVLPQILLVLVAIKPLKIFGSVGAAFLALAFFVFLYEVAGWLFGEAVKPVRSVNAVLGLALFGLQTFFFGLLAQLITLRSKD